MSVSIATMGKFWPQFGSGGETIVEIDGGGGGSYGFDLKKPQVIVDGVHDEDDDIRIRITKVIEWS